jgi:hypothetical protein
MPHPPRVHAHKHTNTPRIQSYVQIYHTPSSTVYYSHLQFIIIDGFVTSDIDIEVNGITRNMEYIIAFVWKHG